MKTIEKAIVLGLILSILFSITSFEGRCENISEKVLRLHILANSDSENDQKLKLNVRDKILEYSKDYLSTAQNKDDAKNLSSNYLNSIEEVAEKEVKNEGYDYPIKVELCNMYFNTREYDNITMPAGRYDALRVLIGEGKGHNWWCVMFPPICLGAAKEEKKLDSVLNENELDVVENGQEYEIKFKIVELFETFRDWIYSFWG
jgi:stage II sporulation protein R